MELASPGVSLVGEMSDRSHKAKSDPGELSQNDMNYNQNIPMSVPQRGTTNPEELEHAPGRERENLEGWIPQLASDEEVRQALEKAFDYRGDVSITLKNGEKVEGYIFDRRSGKSLADSVVRLYPKSGNQKLSVSYADIAALAFTGKDTAAGKSWEAWMKKYQEKKAAGEKNIGLQPEALE